jgi:hypothetical protein
MCWPAHSNSLRLGKAGVEVRDHHLVGRTTCRRSLIFPGMSGKTPRRAVTAWMPDLSVREQRSPGAIQ